MLKINKEYDPNKDVKVKTGNGNITNIEYHNGNLSVTFEDGREFTLDRRYDFSFNTFTENYSLSQTVNDMYSNMFDNFYI